MTDADHIAVRSFDHDGFLLDSSDCEYRHLRLHDDRSAHHIAEGADIGQGEGAALDLIGFQLAFPGAVGQFFWSGVAGTFFWIDPAEQLFAVLMSQGPGQRDYFRSLLRDTVYAAVE